MAYKTVRSFVLITGWLVSALVTAADYEASAMLEFQAAINTNNANGQAVQLSVEPEVLVYFENGSKLTAIGRLRAEMIDGLEPGDVARDSYSSFSRSVLLSNEVELELREFFLETAIGNNFLTIGKQQVVWGKADGLKVLDVINPQSFREFILEDFEDSRIPLWMMNFEWQITENSDLQLLWIPDQTMHVLPDRDATYAFTTPRIVPLAPPGVAVELSPVNRPSRIIADSDIGLRWTAFLGGWDLTLNYLYHYDDLPVFFQRLSIKPTGPKVVVEPGYERSHLFGATFSNAFGDLTIRGELGYSTDKFFLTTDRTDTDGVLESDEFSYVLGFDWFGFEDTLISFQSFQSVVVDSPAELTRPKLVTTLTLLIEKEFLNETLKAEVLVLQNLNDGDGLIRPKITYDLEDDLTVWVGLDFFHGDRQGLFGEFDENDRLLVGFEIGF